jgi:hypothetical protein
MIKELDECDDSLLNQKEEYWIKQYNTSKSEEGYNIISDDDKVEVKIEIPVPIPEKKIERTEPWGFQLKENRGNGKHSSKRVMGINVETGEQKIWESITAAALEVNGKSGNIHGAIKHGWKAYGYRWKKLDNTPNKTPIRGVHKRTWEEIRFESINAAGRYFGSSNMSGIQNSLRNPHKYTYKQYYWFYN